MRGGQLTDEETVLGQAVPRPGVLVVTLVVEPAQARVRARATLRGLLSPRAVVLVL